MSKTINITITSAGPDLGPYSVLLVDNLGNITTFATGVPKSSLFAPGYTIVINDNILSIRLQSVNTTCPFTEFFVPPSPPPDPACFTVIAANGSTITWTDYLDVEHTETYNSSSPVYCARVGSISSSDNNAIISGGTVDCLDGICPATTTTSSTTTTTTQGPLQRCSFIVQDPSGLVLEQFIVFPDPPDPPGKAGGVTPPDPAGKAVSFFLKIK